MVNGYFNNSTKSSPVKASGGGTRGNPQGSGGKSAPFKEKPGFPGAGLPGKAQPKDRSGGVKRAKVRPDDAGL